MADLKIAIPELYDLDKIFDCGQCFRFAKDGQGTWNGIVRSEYLSFTQKDGYVEVNGTADESFISDFFSLSVDYQAINDDIMTRLEGNTAMSSAIEKGKGIRILSQDRWETICSFIVSQNNNIPRIKGIIERLCRLCGEKIGEGKYAFPTVENVADVPEKSLADIGLGYRVDYISRVSKAIASDPSMLDGFSGLDTPSLDKALRSLHGIGPKVAGCIELFGFKRYDVFPIDVWIRKALENQFAGISPFDFGPYRGIAQQYIFYSQIHG